MNVVFSVNAGRVRPGAGRSAPLLGALVALGLVLLCVLRAQQPPAPRGVDTPAAEFSAVRALTVLRELAGPERPHPVGSPENIEVRRRILAVLARMGIAAHVETGFACHSFGSCAQVNNIVAELPGQQENGWVMLSAHYDSVGAGPGISDDLASVAAGLETARALRASAPLRHPVLLLFDDGEEAGILGAQAFVDASPEAKAVVADVNLEARGTAGPSLLFETSGAESWAIPRFAALARHPQTSSLFALVYRELPNDSDLTVFRAHGITGLNFAFIGEPQHYHTPLDNIALLSPASLQHQGDNALAALESLADADPPAAGRAAGSEVEVFFDVLGATIVHWREGPVLRRLEQALAIAALLFAGLAFTGRLGLQRLPFFLGMCATPLALMAGAVIGFALRFGLLAGSFPTVWVAHPLPAIVAAWASGFAMACSVISLLARQAQGKDFWFGLWWFWALAGLGISGTVAPEAGYLFLVPAAVAALGAFWVARRVEARSGPLVEVIPTLVAALVSFPVALALYTAVGGLAIALLPAIVAVLGVSLAPVVARAAPVVRGLLIFLVVAVAVAATIAAVFSPAASRERPQPITVQYFADETAGIARWIAAAPSLPPALRAALPAWSPKPERAFPWSAASGLAFRAPAPRWGLPAPTLEILGSRVNGRSRQVRIRVKSGRAAPVIFLLVPSEAGLESASVEGTPVPRAVGKQRAARGGGWFAVGDLTTPASGCEMVLTLHTTQPFDGYLVDRTAGLPAAGRALSDARSSSHATAIHDGDRTVIARRVRV